MKSFLRMDSITSYFPGAVSDFLVRKKSDTTVSGKGWKRKKGTESGNDESMVLFKKCVTKSHVSLFLLLFLFQNLRCYY